MLTEVAKSALLALKVPVKLKSELENKYPDVTVRNGILKAVIKKLCDGSIKVTALEVN